MGHADASFCDRDPDRAILVQRVRKLFHHSLFKARFDATSCGIWPGKALSCLRICLSIWHLALGSFLIRGWGDFGPQCFLESV